MEGALRAHLDEQPGPVLVQRLQAPHELDRRGHLTTEEVEHGARSCPARAGRSPPVDIGDDRADAGGRSSSRDSIRISGSLAGATIEVWKAWLTGIRLAGVHPASANTARAASTAAVAPPMTAWLVLLTFATTT